MFLYTKSSTKTGCLVQCQLYMTQPRYATPCFRDQAVYWTSWADPFFSKPLFEVAQEHELPSAADHSDHAVENATLPSVFILQ